MLLLCAVTRIFLFLEPHQNVKTPHIGDVPIAVPCGEGCPVRSSGEDALGRVSCY